MVDGDGTAAALTPADRANGDEQLSKLAELSRAMVRLYKEQFGRGPTRAHASWGGQDTLLIVLEDSLTPAEKNLRDLGEHQRLRELRMFFQYASMEEFCEPIERITGQKVRSFISGIDTDTDVSVETFILHPKGSDALSRTETHGARPMRSST
jgi:uncharacterized protein YbcI